MAGLTASMIKNYTAEAAVEKRRIVKFGTADGQVVKGAASTDFLVGVTTEVDAAIGEPCDVIRAGLADVVYGGAVTRGDMLTSDANGKAVAAAPGAGVNARVIGVAEISGVLDDIGVVSINPGRIQG